MNNKKIGCNPTDQSKESNHSKKFNNIITPNIENFNIDERLINIFKLVYLLNSKGEKLFVNQCYLQLEVRDRANECEQISKEVYLHDPFWEDEFDQRVDKLLEILEEKWRIING